MLVVTAPSNSRQATRARSSGWPAAVWTTIRPSSPSSQQRIWELIRGWRSGTISRTFASSVITSTREEAPKPKPEAWYRQFLDGTERPQSRKPHYHLASHGINPGDLLQVFRNRQEYKSLVKSLCLENYITYVHGQASNLPQARQHFLTDRPGACALSSFLQTDACHDLDHNQICRFLQCLAHCFVAENDTESLWQWVRVTESPGFAQTSSIHASGYRCRSDLLMRIVKAQVFWSDSPYYASDAVSAVLNGVPPDLKMSKTPAISHICINAPGMAASFKDVELYERLLSLARRLFDGRDRRLACLDLTHPTRPSADRFLDSLSNMQTAVSGEGYQQLLVPTNPAQMERLSTSIMEAVRVSVVQSKESEARWILDVAYDHVPSLFECT